MSFFTIASSSNNIFKVGDILGEGSSAEVYSCEQEGHQDRPLVIKFVRRTFQHQYIQEVEVLQKIRQDGVEKFPLLVDYGEVPESLRIARWFQWFIVEERLGLSVETVFEKNMGFMKQADVLKLGVELIKKVQVFHEMGYLHLDLKTDNFLFQNIDSVKQWNRIMSTAVRNARETGDKLRRKLSFCHRVQYGHLISSEIYINDFGTCKKYTTNENKHVKNVVDPCITKKLVHRNLYFASKNYFSGQTLSRRDDIISIFYSLILLLDPPFFKMKQIAIKNKSNVFEQMAEYKLNTPPSEILTDPRSRCLLKAMEEAYSYQYDDTPLYGKLIFLLQNELLSINCIPDRTYTWFQQDYPEHSYMGRALFNEECEHDENEPQIQEDIEKNQIREFNPKIKNERQEQINEIDEKITGNEN